MSNCTLIHWRMHMQAIPIGPGKPQEMRMVLESNGLSEIYIEKGIF